MQNLIEAVLPAALPLAGGGGATLVVDAGWEVRTARSIALTFRCAGVGGVGARGWGGGCLSVLLQVHARCALGPRGALA